MKITQEVDYALRVVLYLCKLDFGTKVEAKVMSQYEKVPIRFLLKILRKLTHSGIINSFRGVNGGYALARLPEEIRLIDVMEAVDGPVYVARCIIEPEACNAQKMGKCQVHKALGKVQKVLSDELKNITFKNIMENNFL